MSDDERNYGYEEGGGDDYEGYEDETGGDDQGNYQDEYQGGYEHEGEQYEQQNDDDQPEYEDEEEGDVHEKEPEEEQEEVDEREHYYEEEPQDNHEDFREEDDKDWKEGEESVSCGYSNNAEDSGPCETATAKGVFDGFEGGFSGLISNISHLAGGESGGLSNIFTSGGLEGTVEKMISEAAHRFVGVDVNTGAIIGAIAGNLIFNMGGKQNSLGSIGKMILENIITGKFHRDIHPFVPPVPTGTTNRFGLNFQEERDKCLRERRLFEDPEFPATDRSLYYKTPPEHSVQWLRPGEIVSDPQLIVGQQSRFAVKQGALGDCWLLAAVANLTLRDELFYRVVVPDQSFTENYAGIFHFQFWRYGKWVDVVIDDKLPCSDGRLIYMHSHDGSEFWSALLEKAYAKLYGSYENLEGGTTAEALEDFTGGLTEFFDLRKADKSAILALMIRGMQMGSLFGCSIDADPAQKEAPLDNGLVRGHAYSITSLHSVNVRGQEIPLVRVRNPWGNHKEWNGEWSDSSSEWNWISDEERQKLGVNFSKDGEFWMSFDDFFTNFQELEICNMSADVMNEIMQMTGVSTEAAPRLPQSSWSETQEDGEWSISNNTAGGCTNSPETYPNNPQFGSMFTVTEKSVENDGKCTVIVAVLQKYRRELRTQGKDSLPIGFAVYEIDHNHYGPLPKDFFHGRKPVARNKVFINTREVTARFRVIPGSYVIIPCTFEPGCDADFLLRIYANGELQTARLR